MSRKICISMDFFFKKILEIKSYTSLLDFRFAGTLFRMEVKSDHDTWGEELRVTCLVDLSYYYGFTSSDPIYYPST